MTCPVGLGGARRSASRTSSNTPVGLVCSQDYDYSRIHAVGIKSREYNWSETTDRLIRVIEKVQVPPRVGLRPRLIFWEYLVLKGRISLKKRGVAGTVGKLLKRP